MLRFYMFKHKLQSKKSLGILMQCQIICVMWLDSLYNICIVRMAND